MTYIAFASTLLYLYISDVQNRFLRFFITSAAVSWIFITGWIRLYFSSHYIPDIFGGMAWDWPGRRFRSQRWIITFSG